MLEQPPQCELTDEEIDALVDELLKRLAGAQSKVHASQIELAFGRQYGLIGNQSAVERFEAARKRKWAERTSTEMEALTVTIEMEAQRAQEIVPGIMDTRELPAATPLPLSAIIPLSPPEDKE